MSPQPRPRPALKTLTKRELISLIEGMFAYLEQREVALHALMTGWDDGIPPDVRARIQVEIYNPLLRQMIDLGLRP